MKTSTRAILRASAIAAVLLCCGQSRAQTAPSPATASDAPAADDEVIQLNMFTVTAQKEGRYSAAESTAGSRVASNLFTSTQSIAVITREAIEDTAATRILDVAKYVSGITESTIPNGLDRTTIRGFQVDGQTVDGFRSGAQTNLDPVFVDRIEVVKGPNAILAPSGVPGGTINNVSRKPELTNKESVAASWGLYDGVRTEFDVNRYFSTKAGNKLAFRTVGVLANNSDGWRGETSHIAGVSPMFMYQTKAGSQLTLQGVFYAARQQNDLGIPIDPSAGTNTGATTLSGVSRTLNTSDDDYRFERRQEFRGLFTTPITDDLSMRLAGRYTNQYVAFSQDIGGISNESISTTSTGAMVTLADGVTPKISGNSGGGYDPRNGQYVPGKVFYVSPTGTVTEYAATPAARTLSRGGQYQPTRTFYMDVQNDYAHKLELSFMKLTSVAGWLYSYTKNNAPNYVTSKAPINYDSPAAANYVVGAKTGYQISVTDSQQFYVSETASFFNDKLAFNGNYYYDNFELTVVDKFATPRNTIADVDTQLRSWGVVVKPIDMLSAYYSYNEVASPTSASTIQNNSGNTLQQGKQREYGVRFQGFDKRLYVTAAHFEIKQNNYGIPNPANLTVPPPSPLLPNLLSDRTAKGWEVEFRATITQQLSILGNYTKFTNRDANNVPFRGTAEQSGALLSNYQFEKGSSLSGLSLGLGLDYRGKAPGDQASGLTSYYAVPNQPSFYVDSRLLVNLMASYKFNEKLKAQLTVNNLLDKKYNAAAVNRANVYPGASIDPQIRVTYNF